MTDRVVHHALEKPRDSVADGYLPLGVRVSGLRVVIVGGGRVGCRKAKTLLEAGAWVTVVSPEIGEGLERLLHRERLVWLQEGYRVEHLRQASLAIAATFDRTLNLQIGRDAEASAHVVVVASDGPDWWREEVAAAARAGTAVLDLTGDHAWHDAGQRCHGLTQVASVPLTTDEAVQLSQARSAAFERAVEWDAERRPALPLGSQLRVACRGSELSRVQTDWIVRLLRWLAPDVSFATLEFDSPGDRDRETPLPEVTSGDFFTRDLDEALLSGAADIAVHSAKDLPDDLPAGLKVASLTPAFAPWDCIVTRDEHPLADLPGGARIGTSRLIAGAADVGVFALLNGKVPNRARLLQRAAAVPVAREPGTKLQAYSPGVSSMS